MPKFDDSTIDLRRAVNKVQRLYARLLYSHDSIWLLDCDEVELSKLAAYLHSVINNSTPRVEAPDVSTFTKKTHFFRKLDGGLIASGQHALKQLLPQVKTLSKLPVRALGVRVDSDWLNASQARIDQLSTQLGALLNQSISSNSDALKLWLNKPSPKQHLTQTLTEAQIHLALVTGCPTDDHFGDAALLDEAVARYWADKDRTSWERHNPSGWALLDGWSYTEAYQLCVTLLMHLNAPKKEVTHWWPQLAKGLEPTLIWPHLASIEVPSDYSLAATRTYLLLAAALKQRGLNVLVAKHQEPMLQSLAKQISKSSAAAQLAMSSMLLPLVLEKRTLSTELFAYVDTVLEFNGERTLVSAPPIKAGIGLSTAPDYAVWLNDDRTLDAYLSAQVALKQKPQISRRLLADFSSDRAHEAGATTRTIRRLQRSTAELVLEWRMVSVDMHLRSELGKLLGVTLQVWSEDWRDAARLYFGLDCNQKALKILLIAAAQGRAESLRTELPCNVKWLEKAGKHFSVDAWLNPPETDIEFNDKRYRLHAERNPLQALRMGLPFDTCLSIDDGCNRFSAVLNAMDANKWVWYLRDAKGSIIARKLVAISKKFEVLGFHLYCSIKGNAALNALIDAHLLAWLDTCKLKVASTSSYNIEPECLADEHWYNDGVIPFVPQVLNDLQPNSVAQYCLLLGVPIIENPSSDLIREADLAMAARRGELRALPRYRFSDPGEYINCKLLVEQHGESAVAQAYRTLPNEYSSALNPWAERQAYHSGAIQYWEFVTRLEEWDHRSFPPVKTGEHLPLIRKILTTLQKISGGQDDLDDHGLEHATLRWLPQLLLQVPSEKVVVLANEASSAWHAIDHRFGGHCEDCFMTANDDLRNSILQHWLNNAAARTTMRRDILRIAQSSTTSHPFARVLLQLIARMSLQTDQSLEGLIFGIAPATDRAVLKALNSLMTVHPSLANTPLIFTAQLQHTAPEDVVLEHLYWPVRPPFGVLLDLMPHHPKIMLELRRYAPKPDAAIDLTNKGLVYWLKHVRVGWHETLVERVVKLDEHSEWAASALVQCGSNADIETAKQQIEHKAYHHKVKLRNTILNILKSRTGEVKPRQPVLDFRNVLQLLLSEETLPEWAHEVLPDLLSLYSLSMSACDWMLYSMLRDHPELNRYADRAAPKMNAWPYHAVFDEIPQSEQEAWLTYAIQQFAAMVIEVGFEPSWIERLACQFSEQNSAEIWLIGYRNRYDFWSKATFLRTLTPTMIAKLRELKPEDVYEKNAADANAWLKWRLEESL